MDELIKYDCRWSADCDDSFINDFNWVQDQVFSGAHTRESFRHQYIDNPFGASVLVVVYLEGKPVAARALWRNDIYDKMAYQPGRTCVLPVCRGKGIFREMTMRAIAMLPSDAIIYNFPNQNSFPGYIKMGWKLLHDYGLRLMLSTKDYFAEHPTPMDDDYAEWWVVGKAGIYHVKRGGHYFLVRHDHRPLLAKVVASVSQAVAQKFPPSPRKILFYKSERKTFYSKYFMKSHVVCRNTDIGYIPTWKIDAI